MGTRWCLQCVLYAVAPAALLGVCNLLLTSHCVVTGCVPWYHWHDALPSASRRVLAHTPPRCWHTPLPGVGTHPSQLQITIQAMKCLQVYICMSVATTVRGALSSCSSRPPAGQWRGSNTAEGGRSPPLQVDPRCVVPRPIGIKGGRQHPLLASTPLSRHSKAIADHARRPLGSRTAAQAGLPHCTAAGDIC
jgi:hypothetical protein